jgi:hypothetical protein
LKEVDVDKPSQTWDDEDVKEFDEEKWIAIPLSFYGLEEEG